MQSANRAERSEVGGHGGVRAQGGGPARAKGGPARAERTEEGSARVERVGSACIERGAGLRAQTPSAPGLRA